MRTFWVLVGKELRELVTLQMLAPFVVVIIMFVGIGNVISSAGEDAAKSRVTVIDSDRSAYSAQLTTSLEQAGLDVAVVEADDPAPVIKEQSAAGTGLFVHVPKGFTQTIESGTSGTVRVHTVMTTFSLMGMADDASVKAGLALAGQAIAAQLAAEKVPGVSLQLLQQPVLVTDRVTIGDRSADVTSAEVTGFISQQTVFIPVILFVVIVFAAQLIATTIATEKENKTLETLLSYPISRTALVTAKMFAAGLVSLIAAGAYMVGMGQYMSGLEAGFGGAGTASSGTPAVMQQLGLVLGASDYVALGLSLFAGILLALSISIILGAFAESVRAVGALITPLMVLLMVPYMLTMFVDLNTASPVLKWGVLAIPFAHPFMAAQNLFLGDDRVVWLGTAYQTLWFVVFALLAARIFSSDRILTMKLDLRRKK